MEKEILILLAILTNDHLYKQVYAGEIKMLFDMLKREQGNYLKDEYPTPINQTTIDKFNEAIRSSENLIVMQNEPQSNQYTHLCSHIHSIIKGLKEIESCNY